MDDESSSTPMSDGVASDVTPLESFLHQPARDAAEDHEAVAATSSPLARTTSGFWGTLNNFLFKQRPSRYSSIAPRGADGRRTKIFFFNGNGRGR